jgi:D-amino-acid dehydrogenase
MDTGERRRGSRQRDPSVGGDVNDERHDVVVVGAGAVGAAIALELVHRGYDVLVLERGTDWAAGCSFANAGLICPSHAGPWATAADLGQASRWLLRPDSPLGMRPSASLVPFLTSLLLMRRRDIRRVTALSRAMCSASLAMHEALSSRGVDTGFRRAGLLDVYATERGMDRGRRSAAAHLEAGVTCRVLEPREVLRLEPALDGAVAGGVHFPREAHCDPARFVASVGEAAVAGGAALRGRTEVLCLSGAGSAVQLTTTSGPVRAGTVVLATGVWAGRLARPLGASLPLQGGKGYSIDLRDEGRAPLNRPLMLQEARVAVTPLRDRLRLAGTMQLEGLDEAIDLRRARAVLENGRRYLPGWRDAAVDQIWSGLRPCTPDGLPLIGWLRDDMRVAVASGHAMLGLTLAPWTGELVADLLEGSQRQELAELDPHRFGRGPRLRGVLG